MSTAMTTYAKNTSSELIITSTIGLGSVMFLAFVTSFSQTFSSNWNKEAVYGRQDPIGTFQNTERVISIGWDIPAGTLDESQSNLAEINGLIQMLYPAYSSGRQTKEGATTGVDALSLSKSPLVRIQYANLINAAVTGEGLLGWIGSISWNPVLDMGMFTTGTELFPKVISLTLEFNVLHEHDLGITPSGKAPASFPFGG